MLSTGQAARYRRHDYSSSMATTRKRRCHRGWLTAADSGPGDFARGRSSSATQIIEHLASLPLSAGRARSDMCARFSADLRRRSRRPFNAASCDVVIAYVEARPASANFAEDRRYVDDDEADHVFSDAQRRQTRLSRRCRLPKASASASTTCWSRVGRPMPRSRASAARTAPTRSNRRCFGPSRPGVEGEKRFLSTIARKSRHP